MSTEQPRAGLAIVLPAFNEADRIGPALDELFGYLHRRGELARDGSLGAARLPEAIEVLVVDDGSTDATVDIVEARPEATGSRPGRHHAARCSGSPTAARARRSGPGCSTRPRDLIVFADADMATPPDQLPLLVAALADHDVSIGSRIQADGSDMRASQPGYRRILGKAFHLFASIWVVGPVQDTQCGFKGFTRDVAHDLFARQQITSIVFDVELIYMARRRGYRLAIVPIHWYDRRGSRMRARPALALARGMGPVPDPAHPSPQRAELDITDLMDPSRLGRLGRAALPIVAVLSSPGRRADDLVGCAAARSATTSSPITRPPSGCSTASRCTT